MKKKYHFLFTLLVLSLTGHGQSKTTYLPEPGEGFSFNSGLLSVLDAPESFESDARSNSQSFQFMRDNVIGLSHFSVAYGLGYSAQFYHGNVRIDVAEDGTQTLVDLSGRDFISNRFATEYVDAAIELRYRGKVNRNGRYNRFYIGGCLGYRTDAYSYYKDAVYRVKYYQISGFNPLRYGVHIKAGRGPVNAYVYYGLSAIVVDGAMLPEWSEARPLSVGLSVTL
ncbi:MAG: Uncharacterised protein [Flavobacteriales bacterium UBA4585]|nr:MAG: Uncharacterised protein [Flavobacteriales bacterium UBA4585]